MAARLSTDIFNGKNETKAFAPCYKRRPASEWIVLSAQDGMPHTKRQLVTGRTGQIRS